MISECRVTVEELAWTPERALRPAWVDRDVLVLKAEHRAPTTMGRPAYQADVAGTVILEAGPDRRIYMVQVVYPFAAWSVVPAWPAEVLEALKGPRGRAALGLCLPGGKRRYAGDDLSVHALYASGRHEGWVTWASQSAQLRAIGLSESCTALLDGLSLVGFFGGLLPPDRF